MVSLTIDGRPVEVPQGTTVLEAARQVGIEIPTLCHHVDLSIAGACRMCVVEVEGNKKNIPADCAQPAVDGRWSIPTAPGSGRQGRLSSS